MRELGIFKSEKQCFWWKHRQIQRIIFWGTLCRMWREWGIPWYFSFLYRGKWLKINWCPRLIKRQRSPKSELPFFVAVNMDFYYNKPSYAHKICSIMLLVLYKPSCYQCHEHKRDLFLAFICFTFSGSMVPALSVLFERKCNLKLFCVSPLAAPHAWDFWDFPRPLALVMAFPVRN